MDCLTWEQLLEGVIKNIDYASSYTSRRTSLEKEDVYNDILLIVWENYCRHKEKVTIYGMQKRIIWASNRIIKNFYRLKSKANTNKVSLEDVSELETHSLSDRELLAKEIVDSVKKDLKELKEKYYKILNFLSLGYRNKDISDEMNISQKNISVIISRHIKPRLKERALAYGFA